jgi:DNA-binding phage protein
MRRKDITLDGLIMLKMVAEGEDDVEEVLRKAIDDAAFHRRMSKWAKKAGISVPTMSQFARRPDYSITLYTAKRLFEAAGLRLTIEVNE